MSDQSPFIPQDVSEANDMDAWFSMLSCIVNFLSAAANLAIKLEQNYLISNVTNLRKPVLPLLPAPTSIIPLEANGVVIPIASAPLEESIDEPPQLKGNIEELAGDETSVDNAADDDSLCISEQIPIVLTYPESECSDLPQEVRYMNTGNMGDYSGHSFPQEDTEYYSTSSADQMIHYAEDVFSSVDNANQPEEPIKICSSEDVCYFDDFTESERTINSINFQKHYEQTIENDAAANSCETGNDVEDEHPEHHELESVEHKYVQAKTCDRLGKSSKVKPVKTQEIQTNSTNRFKSRVIELITKSQELQQPIKDAIVDKTKTCCRHSIVPKNLNELKEQLDSIKVSANNKGVEGHEQQEKKCLLKSSKIPVDKYYPKRCKKIEKQAANTPNATTCSNHIPLKSPGTSKRFASVESVVKKLIHSSKVVEKDTEENKDAKKVCPFAQRNAKKHETIDEEKTSAVKSRTATVERKEFKIVKNHKDFIYKKNIMPKSEKPKSPSSQCRPASKRVPSRKSSEVNTARSRSPSRGPRSIKNATATVEASRKKEKELKKASSPNGTKLKKRNIEEVCDTQ